MTFIPQYLSQMLFIQIIHQIYEKWCMNPVRGVLKDETVSMSDVSVNEGDNEIERDQIRVSRSTIMSLDCCALQQEIEFEESFYEEYEMTTFSESHPFEASMLSVYMSTGISYRNNSLRHLS